MAKKTDINDINDIGFGFNKIDKEDNYEIDSDGKVNISLHWAPRLLRYSFYLSLFSLSLIVLTYLYLFFREPPEVFTTSTAGEVKKVEVIHINKK